MTSFSLIGELNCTRYRKETVESAEESFIEFKTCKNLSISSGRALEYFQRSAEA